MPSDSARKLYEWIEENNWRQTQVAKLLKCSDAHLSHLLQGKRNPSPTLRERIHRKSKDWSRGPISRDGWDRA